MKIFKKSHDVIEYVTYFVSGLMFFISAILTISLYVEDGTNILSIGIFGGMGFTMELSKIIFLVLLGFFILKSQYKIAIITALLSIILIIISVYANYTYSRNFDSRKLDSNKRETQQYRYLASQKSKLEKDLTDLKSSKLDKESSIKSYDKQIETQTNQKDRTISKYEDVWSKNNTAKEYNKEIERLQTEKNNLSTEIKNIDIKIDDNNKLLGNINTKLASTKQYSYKSNKGVNSNVIRILLGVMFEVIAVGLFFIGVLRKNTLLKEKQGIQSPQEIFQSAINDMIINATLAYTEQIKAQTQLFSQNIKPMINEPINENMRIEIEEPVKQIEEKELINNHNNLDLKENDIEVDDPLDEDLEVEKVNYKFPGKPLAIENIRAYHNFILENSKDDIAVGYKKVAENLGLRESEAQRIYNKLKEKNYLKSSDRKTLIEKKEFDNNDFLEV